MIDAKKCLHEAATSWRHRPRLAPRTTLGILYQILGKMQAPIRTGKEVSSPVTWGLLFTIAGVFLAVKIFMDFLDWLERT